MGGFNDCFKSLTITGPRLMICIFRVLKYLAWTLHMLLCLGDASLDKCLLCWILEEGGFFFEGPCWREMRKSEDCFWGLRGWNVNLQGWLHLGMSSHRSHLFLGMIGWLLNSPSEKYFLLFTGVINDPPHLIFPTGWYKIYSFIHKKESMLS